MSEDQSRVRFYFFAIVNCRIDEKGVIKVSDFGLTEDVYMKKLLQAIQR